MLETSLPAEPRKCTRAIFSALIGDYEQVTHRPVEARSEIDYYFFSDSANIDPGDVDYCHRRTPHQI